MRPQTSSPPGGRTLLRTLIPLLLVGLFWSCGGEDGGEQASTRTGGIFGGTPAPSSGSARSAPETPAQQPSPPPQRARIDISDLGHTLGSEDAPIRVVEFSDFGCGYCRKFHVETFPTIRDEYVETGKVAWKYIPYVLGIFPNGVESARAGECAIAQGAFPRYGQRLFEDQDAWKEENEPLDAFIRLARDEGLDVERFRTCYEERLRDDRVQRNMDLGQRVGIRGTPTFLIEGQLVSGALPLETFREIFDTMLAQEESGGGPTVQSEEGGGEE